MILVRRSAVGAVRQGHQDRLDQPGRQALRGRKGRLEPQVRCQGHRDLRAILARAGRKVRRVILGRLGLLGRKGRLERLAQLVRWVTLGRLGLLGRKGLRATLEQQARPARCRGRKAQ